MNEGLTIFLNIDREKADENEELVRRIDEFLENFGIKYSGVENIYCPVDRTGRDDAISAACRALSGVVWLKGKLAYVSVMNMTNVCSMEEIRPDDMEKPSESKLEYYEKFYQESNSLAHGIVVDENRQLRDGYISYIIAQKYGINPSIYEAFAKQPLKKVIKGRHVVRMEGEWKVKSNKFYCWNYTLKNPVVPGDILKADTKNGKAFVCVDRIEYVTGKEFCEEYRDIIKHMGKRI
ncbi:MAG: hypothetical protein HFI02_16175 [Lachnospiraceae bacterium]|nr:hypothetical protein [Lachnospiraceae bacterium]